MESGVGAGRGHAAVAAEVALTVEELGAEVLPAAHGLARDGADPALALARRARVAPPTGRPLLPGQARLFPRSLVPRLALRSPYDPLGPTPSIDFSIHGLN